MKVKFEDLKPGMLVDRGLVVRVGEAGSNKFYEGKAHIQFFDMNDSYSGQCSTSVEPGQEFEVIHDIGTDEYREAVQSAINERANYLSDTEADIDLLQAYKRLES